MCLTKAQKPPMYIVSLVDLLWARIVAFVLWPLHMLAEKLVHKKIRSSIGISKVKVSEHFFYHTRKIARLIYNLFLVSSRLVLVEVVVYLCMLTSFSRLDRKYCFLNSEINSNTLLSVHM